MFLDKALTMFSKKKQLMPENHPEAIELVDLNNSQAEGSSDEQ